MFLLVCLLYSARLCGTSAHAMLCARVHDGAGCKEGRTYGLGGVTAALNVAEKIWCASDNRIAKILGSVEEQTNKQTNKQAISK